MVLWWIGNAILLFVVLPVVIALLNRVLADLDRNPGDRSLLVLPAATQPARRTLRAWPPTAR